MLISTTNKKLKDYNTPFNSLTRSSMPANGLPQINQYSHKYPELWRMSRKINKDTAARIYNQLNDGTIINIQVSGTLPIATTVGSGSSTRANLYQLELDAYYRSIGDGNSIELKLSNDDRRRIRKDLIQYLQLNYGLF